MGFRCYLLAQLVSSLQADLCFVFIRYIYGKPILHCYFLPHTPHPVFKFSPKIAVTAYRSTTDWSLLSFMFPSGFMHALLVQELASQRSQTTTSWTCQKINTSQITSTSRQEHRRIKPKTSSCQRSTEEEKVFLVRRSGKNASSLWMIWTCQPKRWGWKFTMTLGVI